MENMRTQEFLSENRNEVINYFNNEISNYWTISLKDFMVDLMNNFRKISIKEQYTRMDLMGNLQEAKSRLGMFDKCIVVAEDKVTNALRRKYEGTAYMALV
jgi:KaiC/GvpD/RAD55 family RecA-like ATPase